MQIESVMTVQHNFRCQYGGEPPKAKTIRSWLNSFKETLSVLKGKSPGIPRTSEATVHSCV